MKISKLKLAFRGIFGGVSGVVKYLLEVFNDQILAKIKDKKTGTMYLKDVNAVIACVEAIGDNHSAKMSKAQKKALKAILDALKEMSAAIEDFHIDEEELEMIVEKIKEAIDAFKSAK